LKVAFLVSTAAALSLWGMSLAGPRTLRPALAGLGLIFLLMALGAFFSSRRVWLVISIFNNLAILLFFKYARFVLENFQHVLSWLQIHVTLPDPAAHLERVGRSLNTAVESYNRAAASMETRVLVAKYLDYSGFPESLIAEYKSAREAVSTERFVDECLSKWRFLPLFLDYPEEGETNARIQIGTTPPIDAVEAEAEVATREEAVIVAQAQIDTAQDALRALVFNQSSPDFWTTQIEPTDLPAFQPVTVDVNGAVSNALQMRTDLLQARKSLEENDINIRYFRNQTLPDVTASFDYGLTGLGGTQFVRGTGFPGPIIGETQRSFGSVLGDLFGNQFPNWTLALNISYPVGHSQQEASLARAQLQSSQAVTQLRNAELQVVTQVRNVARQVTTNAKRVASTGASRSLAEQRLDAEQRKLAAGTSTSFFVFQAQRDLAQARNNELNAILDYNRSVVDLETVQLAPVVGAGVGTASTATAATVGVGVTPTTAISGGTTVTSGAP